MDVCTDFGLADGLAGDLLNFRLDAILSGSGDPVVLLQPEYLTLRIPQEGMKLNEIERQVILMALRRCDWV